MTQEYTPVQWEDETPTTPGTLINKARLDQMQTAHHFADGFEEVDTVPTADPGVDYHKVVFCTADTTFYRWDGTQWVKDVDDSTLALLEAHEADHANPHEVTKEQVGLGNCDNTADLDKPISTATQTALDLKADKTQLSDGSVTKIGTSTVGGNLKPIYLNAGVPTAVSDNLVSTAGNQTIAGIKTFETASFPIKSASDKYIRFNDGSNTSVCWIVGKNDGAIDITVKSGAYARLFNQRAYNSSNANDIATIATLDAYTPMVRITNNQSVAGNKDFTNGLFSQFFTANISSAGTYLEVRYKGVTTQVAKIEVYDFINNNATGLAEFIMAWNGGTPKVFGRYLGALSAMTAKYAVDADGNLLLSIPLAIYHTVAVNVPMARSWTANIAVTTETVVNPDYTGLTMADVPISGTGAYAVAATRTYNSANESDIVTIGTLKTATDVVHTTGNESIAGVKTFTDNIIISKGTPDISLKDGVDVWDTAPSVNRYHTVSFLDKNGDASGGIAFGHYTTGQKDAFITNKAQDGTIHRLHLITEANGTGYATCPNRTYNASNTSDIVNIALLDSYTHMVRTSGNNAMVGNYNISGTNLTNKLTINSTDGDVTNTSPGGTPSISFYDMNGVKLGSLWMRMNGNGTVSLRFDYRKSDGTTAYYSLVDGS